MGLLDKRKTKIAERAGEHMEAGEEVVKIAMTNQAENRKRGRNVAIAVTDRNVYLFVISLMGVTKIGSVGAKIPVAEAQLSGDGDVVHISNVADPTLQTLYPLLGAGKDAEELLAFLAERGAGR